MVLVAFLGRLPLSMVGLGTILLIASETHSYGLGGAVAAVGAVTTALAGPVIGRLADTFGQRRGVVPGAGGFLAPGGGFPPPGGEGRGRRGPFFFPPLPRGGLPPRPPPC